MNNKTINGYDYFPSELKIHNHKCTYCYRGMNVVKLVLWPGDVIEHLCPECATDLAVNQFEEGFEHMKFELINDELGILMYNRGSGGLELIHKEYMQPPSSEQLNHYLGNDIDITIYFMKNAVDRTFQESVGRNFNYWSALKDLMEIRRSYPEFIHFLINYVKATDFRRNDITDDELSKLNRISFLDLKKLVDYIVNHKLYERARDWFIAVEATKPLVDGLPHHLSRNERRLMKLSKEFYNRQNFR